MYNRNLQLFPSTKIIGTFQKQDSLPTHVDNIGQPIYENWEAKTWV